MSISAKQGQVVSLKLSTLMEGTYIAIANSAGDTGSSRRYVSAGGVYDGSPAPADGEYTVLIDPDQAVVGTFTLTATLKSP
jgi:hypothetical protein